MNTTHALVRYTRIKVEYADIHDSLCLIHVAKLGIMEDLSRARKLNVFNKFNEFQRFGMLKGFVSQTIKTKQ